MSKNTKSLYISRDNSLALKGIAILYVLLGHMGILKGAGSWGVHVFSFVSGYGLTCSTEKVRLEKYWQKRIKNVYFPYLFCTILFLLVRRIFIGRLEGKVLIASLLGLDFGINADQTMWYISYVFCCYFVFWLFVKLSERNIFLAVSVSGILWIGMAAAGLLGLIWHRGTVAWAYVFTFPMGIAIGILRNKQIQRRWFNIGCILIGGCSLLVVIRGYGTATGGIELFLYSFSAFLCTLVFSFITEFFIFKRMFRWVKTIGEYSFYMYLNEGLLLEIRNIYFHDLSRCLTNAVVLLFSFLLAVALCRLENGVANRIAQSFYAKEELQ